MRRIIIICILLGTSILPGFSQSRHYLVEKNYDFKRLCFTLRANSGTCFIKPARSENPINIFGEPRNNKITPQFHTKLVNGTQHIEFRLRESNPAGFGQRLSARVFGGHRSEEKNEWHVYLTRTKPLFLNLNYGMGNANVDLSGLSVKQLIIDTGSAEVNVGYNTYKANSIAMDTFYVKVDMGNLHLGHINLARAKDIIADVGFGNLSMDFSDTPYQRSHVTASVGAGTLVINLPGGKTPVLVRINNSPLCRISVPDNFRKIRSNTYANESYSERNAPDLLSFDLDVAMGKISFVTD